MAMVVIQTPALSADQKRRIGERVISLLQNEGFAPGGVVVLFRPESQDLYLDGLLFEAERQPEAAPVAAPAPAPVPEPAPAAPAAPTFKAAGRRTKHELEDLRQRLIQKLQMEGSLSSFEAQEALGLKDFDWAPGTLRRLFTDLEEEKLITKTGQKRGTRYQWKGIVSTQSASPAVKLVKADSEE
ncbi:MAG TPA: hypothetical protein VF768_07975 [Holophagaceae bacterium]